MAVAESLLWRRLLPVVPPILSGGLVLVSSFLHEDMGPVEARVLVERSIPRFKAAGLPALDASSIKDVRARSVARLWGGMGNVYELTVSSSQGPDLAIMAKRIKLPSNCTSIGDQRKKDSYDVEAAFYSNGHAERLIKAGCVVPFPLFVEHSRDDGLTICMTKLEGRSGSMDESQMKAVMGWLACLHATYWGTRADAAVVKGPQGGLQPQGCYWHLDTRQEELASMPTTGWEGRSGQWKATGHFFGKFIWNILYKNLDLTGGGSGLETGGLPLYPQL